MIIPNSQLKRFFNKLHFVANSSHKIVFMGGHLGVEDMFSETADPSQIPRPANSYSAAFLA